MFAAPSRVPSIINSQAINFYFRPQKGNSGRTPNSCTSEFGVRPELPFCGFSFLLRDRYCHKAGSPFIRVRVPLQYHECNILARPHGPFGAFEVVHSANLESLASGDDARDDHTAHDSRLFGSTILIHRGNVRAVGRIQPKLANHIRSNSLDSDSQFGLRTITLVVIVRAIVAGAFADNFLPVSDNDRNGLLFTITIDFHVNGAADRAICNDVQERRARTDLCSVDFGDDIEIDGAKISTGSALLDV